MSSWINAFQNESARLRQNQSGNTTQLSNFKTQLALKTFELEQLRQVHVETHKNLLERQIENEKLLKKVEVKNNNVD